MTTTVLSSKGQVIIPQAIRNQHHWEPGQKLAVIDTGDGIVLRPVSPFKETDLKDVGGCLKYSGPARSLEDMEDAIRKGARERTK